jgi:probable rRNA maturation factor
VVTVDSKVRGVSVRALGRFAARAQRAAGVRGEVDVLITSNAELRRLNRRFRGKDTATDVLSFSLDDETHHGGTETRRNSSSKPSALLCLRGFPTGNIAISAEVAAGNARRLGHSAVDELKILILHGLLHLAGYDHELDGGQMARAEARLRRAFGLPAALIERAANGTRAGTDKRRRS